MKTVFLSSTGKDLHDYREAVYSAIEGLDGYHCKRMEDYGARTDTAFIFDNKMVAECDLFVGITGHCYGSIYTPSGKSYTELEYDAALEVNKPRLMFLAPESYPLPANLIESDEHRGKQRLLRDRVNTDSIRDTFTTPDNLAQRVVRAIHNWEQGSSAESIGVYSPITLPLPPQPYFAHPYPLQPNFTGRVSERKLLTEWFTNGDQPVCVIEAIGGMGKSALTWAWVQRDLLGFPLPGTLQESAPECQVLDSARPVGVFWWSFYEERATFPSFVSAAIRYLSNGKLDPRALPSDYDRTEALLALLRQQKVLLILDGFERELRMYASLNASFVGDEVKEDEHGEYRSCITPQAVRFLRTIASAPTGTRILISSRLFPRELEGQDHKALAGCFHLELIGFQPEDAVLFFQRQGIKGTPGEIERICKLYGSHPLTLSLLSGIILEDTEHPGDIRVAPEYDPTNDLKSKEHHILEVAFETLSNDLKQLLSGIAAFRSPVIFEAIKALHVFSNIKQLKGALKALKNRRLLVQFEATERFDLHPIIRRYAYDRLKDKAGTHSKLRDYFREVDCSDSVVLIDELQPVIELYYHTLTSEHFDDAYTLFSDRLFDELFYKFAAYDTIVELLLPLFIDGFEQYPQLLDLRGQSHCLNVLSLSFVSSGKPRRALPLLLIASGIDDSQNDKMNGAISRANLGDVQLQIGNLKNAEENYLFGLEVARNTNYEAVYYRLLAYFWGFCGKLNEMTDATEKAIYNYKLIGHRQGILLARCCQAEIALLLSNPTSALDLLADALKNWQKKKQEDGPIERDRIHIEWLLGWSKVAASEQNRENRSTLLMEAEIHLTDALSSSRRVNLVELQGDILLAWSLWHRTKENSKEAFDCAKEALELADRGESRLLLADAHNMLAQLYLDEGDMPNARKHAEIGKERAYCDGPPYSYKWAYDEAERLLKEIG